MADTGDTDLPRRQRRDKYIAKACQACRRRKIKCSGHDICLNCVDRGTECVYDSERRKRGQRATRRRLDDSRDDTITHDTSGLGISNSPTQTTASDQIWRDPVRTPAISLHSQVATAGSAPGKSATPRPDHGQPWSIRPCDTQSNHYPVQLPPADQVTGLVQHFFLNVNYEYPILSRHDVEDRLASTLTRLDCRLGRTSTLVAVDSEASRPMSLICALFSLSQITSNATPSPSHDTKPPGHAWYEHSKKMLQAFESHKISLDIVRCHTLHTIYALHADMLDAALESHSIAARLLTAVYPPTLCREDEPGRGTAAYNLWWTVFSLDRTLSRTLGISYTLRVNQMPGTLTERLEVPQGNQRPCARRNGLPRSPTPEVEGTQSIDHDPAFLEALGYLGHIWSSLYDQLSSKSSNTGSCGLRTAALLDTELQLFTATLGDELKWHSRGPSTDISSDHVSKFSRRLRILTTTNILRLLLRQTFAGACNCFGKLNADGPKIVRETIDSVQLFRKRLSPGPVPSVLTMTSTLVQCVLYLLTILDDTAEPGSERSESEDTSEMIEEAYSTLLEMAPACWSARGAISTLDAALFTQEAEDPNREEQPTPRLPSSLGQAVTQSFHQGDSRNASKDVRASSLFDELKTGYQNLDLMSPGRLQEDWMVGLSPTNQVRGQASLTSV